MKNQTSCIRVIVAVLLVTFWAGARASLTAYDASVANDASTGLTPLAKLTNAVTLTGANRAAFDFGANSGDVTIEFVLEGNPNVGTGSAYLAVGANTSSNLRYKQFNNTGQLGFTQLGVADYLFSPAVPSPNIPTHIAYVWNAATRTMAVYFNGSFAGSSSGVSASFAMPTGTGWLGANPSNTENMTGTIYRVTVYDDMIPASAIERHADAYNDVVPNIIAFTANPSAYLAPGSSTLTWNVQKASAIFIDGTDVTTASNLVVAPSVTTTYTLTATNNAGSSMRSVTVTVNPPPVINSFSANRTYVGAGATISLNWNVTFGQTFSIAPDAGDVTAQTSNGIGSVNVQPTTETLYTLTASNSFGAHTASVAIHIVQPANHLVISEFMADNASTLDDENGEFSGWIEIHNPTAGTINLGGHFLTDDEAEPTKWAFPSLELAPDAYLLVFASAKDRTNTLPLHTNFKLNNNGEYLALVGPGPLLLHAFAPAFPSQREDISYGILGDDLGLERYFGVPTPGALNNDTPAPPPRPAPVQFSQASGLFTNPFVLTLSAPDSNAVIRFTTNGSIPGVTNGAVYTMPLTVTNTTHIRAVAIVSNIASRLTGASYIRLANDLVGYTSSLPIMVIENFGAGVIPVKPFNGNGAGIKQSPRQFAAWATFDRNGGISAFTNAPQMFAHIGIRSRGGASSQWRQKPFGVEAIEEDGDEQDVSPLGLPAHADWILYFPDADTATSKDATMLFNTFAFELSARTGHYAVRFRFVETFLNEDGGDLRLADRRGVYAIVEKVSRGEDRLDFQRLSSEGTNGGWLLNINRMDSEPDYGWPAVNGATQPWFFHTAGPNRILQTADNALPVQGDDEPQQVNAFINFDNPNGYTINTNQRTTIQNWFKQFEDVLWNDALWRHPVNGYRKYVDDVDFADFFVMNALTRNGDGLLISLFPWKGDDGRLRMGPVWDFNYNTYYISGAATGTLYHRADRLWYKRLFADVDFLQLYIDRWWDHRRGAMSNAGMDAIVDGQMTDISPAKALLNGLPSTTEWSNRLSQFKTWLKDRANWIDSNYWRPPTFNTNGGAVPDGFQVTISGTNGTIYFTTDGADPRASGGAVAASAQSYQGVPITLHAQTLVQARIKSGTNWSGLTAAVFYTPQDLTKLAITEIMYNPPAFGAWNGDELEFVEFKNTGTNTLNLGGLTFTAGINFTFTNGTLLGPGQFFVLARNAAAIASKYSGFVVNGVYTGKLDNSGETLRLSTALTNTVLEIVYNDRAPWPLAPDGWGFSLVPRNTMAADNSSDGSSWRASAALGGSPGIDDPDPTFAPILINEILTHTDPPQVDAVELFNPTASDVNIGGWFLSDDGTVPKKFRIPNGTMIPAGGYIVFTETNFNPTPATLYNFSLDSAGDSLYLASGDAMTNLSGYSHGVTFGAAANGVSFGRYVNSVGEEQFPAQLATTISNANAGPLVGPIVISELMYHPDANGDEFIELRNITANDVLLFDATHPTNTWRVNGIDFLFPTNVVLPSNSFALIVASDPAAFRVKYSVPEEVLVLGPFAGTLQDSGERIELQRPDPEDASGTTFITVDEVRYNDKAPWSPAADGSGPSLQRRIVTDYGNDPTNWFAALPSPGSPASGAEPPIITQQPQSFAALQGANTNLSVFVSGSTPMAFQWQRDGAILPGETNAILPLPNIQSSNAGIYSVVAFNSAGSAYSSNAQVNVLLPVRFTIQPTNQNVQPGTNVTLVSAAAGNGTVRYQWRFEGTNLLNATNTSYSFTNANIAAHHGTFSVVATDDVSAAASSNAFVFVMVKPGFATNPVSQTVLQGGTAIFTAYATGAPPIWYRWLRGGTPLVTNNSGVLVITNVQFPTNNVRVLATNVASGPAGASMVPAAGVPLFILADGDRDGMWDVWETNYFGGTNTSPTADADSDGMINRDEYVAGTVPTNAASVLKIVLSATNASVLTFVAQSNISYSVQCRTNLAFGFWGNITSIAAQTLVRTVQVTMPIPAAGEERYYRVVTPTAP
jgi:hypothetical protein